VVTGTTSGDRQSDGHIEQRGEDEHVMASGTDRPSDLYMQPEVDEEPGHPGTPTVSRLSLHPASLHAPRPP